MRKLKDIYTDEKRCDRRQLYSARCHIFFWLFLYLIIYFYEINSAVYFPPRSRYSAMTSLKLTAVLLSRICFSASNFSGFRNSLPK